MVQHFETANLKGNLRHPKRDWWQALRRGSLLKCPRCGEGDLMERYLVTNHECASCGEELHHHRADDAPPYFTIFIVGHIIVPLVVLVEVMFKPAVWVHMVLWLPLAILLSLWLLPIAKGALIGYQWALYMHGFDPDERGKPDREF